MRALVLGLAAWAVLGSGAQAQSALAPDWARRLVINDALPTTGGRASLAAPGLDFSVRVTIQPNDGGVARVIRIDAGANNQTRLFLRRFTGNTTDGWWAWGPDTPAAKDITAAQRAEVQRLARTAASVAAAGAGLASACPNGERAYVEIVIGGRSVSHSRDCVGNDPASLLAAAVSNLAGSRNEEEMRDAAVEELLEADRAFSALAQSEGVAAAFARYAAEDAHQFAPGQDPVRGQPAVAAFWASWPEGAGFTWAPEHAQVSNRGDMGWTWGRGVTTYNGQRRTSRYVSVWVRDLDGNWRFVVDIGNQDPN